MRCFIDVDGVHIENMLKRLSKTNAPLTMTGLLMLSALAIAIVGMIVDQLIIAGAPAWQRPRGSLDRLRSMYDLRSFLVNRPAIRWYTVCQLVSRWIAFQEIVENKSDAGVIQW
jgi:hypothetical protein